MMRPEDASYAEIRINALLKFIKHIDNCIPNIIDLIALPWNGKQYLSSFPSGHFDFDVVGNDLGLLEVVDECDVREDVSGLFLELR